MPLLPNIVDRALSTAQYSIAFLEFGPLGESDLSRALPISGFDVWSAYHLLFRPFTCAVSPMQFCKQNAPSSILQIEDIPTSPIRTNTGVFGWGYLLHRVDRPPTWPSVGMTTASLVIVLPSMPCDAGGPPPALEVFTISHCY